MLNKATIREGMGFGVTSAILTTLGLFLGLLSSTSSKLAVIGGIVTIALADALSDSFGMHISLEYGRSENKHNVWSATIATFIYKFVFAGVFIIPVLLWSLTTAAVVSIIYGLLVIIYISYLTARQNNDVVWRVIISHVLITMVVILLSFSVGKLVAHYFA
ncbi:MAG: hypothetical protein COX77_02090 [Candidatus Komeilibacteria bacterium CG_4_10_14_0_2_um_filter_37_10]|uniref:VIT family protein n=1 Tax=Candidatus Komeilibacteria bacterium CG_4_10_14_0_2_um_filter_37_10 TaxID=1974470 RepID=A0A2M7VFB9_9BACT|nr:MAG: hypothetical protein COX77_02090 [Candidatus Komeilibacteria bacterium CG_4_10_14_0_2_um_filter_37_10]